MRTRSVKAENVVEGDLVIVGTNDIRRVEDLRENGRMDGVWLEFEDRSALFYNYSDIVRLVDE